MKIPFDALTLASVVHEVQVLVGGKVQRIIAVHDLTLILGIYAAGQEHLLFLNARAENSRAHFIARRPDTPPATTTVTEFRKYLKEGKVVFVRQRGLDRILEIGIQGPEGPVQLVAEIMGKHSNVMVVDEDRRVRAALKWVGPKQSRRPILPGKPYEPPPFDVKPPLTDAQPGDDLRDFDGGSPFLRQLIESGVALAEIQRRVETNDWEAHAIPGVGAYPLPLESLSPEALPRPSLSVALEQHFRELEERDQQEQRQRQWAVPVRRVIKSRRESLREIVKAIAAAERAPQDQLHGELILAYQGQIKSGHTTLDAYDYEGNPVQIPLDQELTAVENAERFFKRAKKAKARAGEMEEQRQRMQAELDAAEALLAQMDDPDADWEAIQAEVERRRWHRQVNLGGTKREEQPFQGHKVRELTSPSGWRVLYGETATANDFLTGKVARPNDWWLHVRGGAGTHVIVTTQNQPQRVPMADLIWAAKVAKRNSASKHSSYVAVDYTLKKYVRKPRGSAPGLAVYTHEKVIHVEDA